MDSPAINYLSLTFLQVVTTIRIIMDSPAIPMEDPSDAGRKRVPEGNQIENRSNSKGRSNNS